MKFARYFRDVSVVALLLCSCGGLAGVTAQAQTGAPVPPPAAAAPAVATTTTTATHARMDL